MWFLRTFGGSIVGLFLFWTLYALNLWLDFIPKWEPYDYGYDSYSTQSYADDPYGYDSYSDAKMEAEYAYDEEMAPGAPSSSMLRELLSGYDVDIGEDYNGVIYSLTVRNLVFNEDLQTISQAVGLEELTLEQPGYITNDGLRHLSGLTQLRRLSLRHADITDDGLYYLEDLPNLSTLDLTGTSVTFDGVSRLRAELPDCNVIY